LTVVACIDIGNSTTEVLLASIDVSSAGGRVQVVGVGRSPTRRSKGSRESLAGAVALVRRLERQYDVRAARAVAAPLRPVATSRASLPEHAPETGRLALVTAGSTTAGGRGFGAGPPVLVGDVPADGEPVVVVVPSGSGYESVAALLAPLVASGRVAAVLVEDDEAVLLANRLPGEVPVVDEVNAAAVLGADRVAVEVAEGGQPLRLLTDPLRLRAALQLTEPELADAARLAGLLFDATNAVVTLGGPARDTDSTCPGWIEVAQRGQVPFLEGQELLRAGGVGEALAYGLPPDCARHEVDDLWAVDLAAVGASVQARVGAASHRPVTLAALRCEVPYADPSAALAELLDVPVRAVAAESRAAWTGAMSTPGAGTGSVVVDLGGGTVDTVSAATDVVAAGAGELLTEAVAALTGITSAAAEWVKRGPAYRVEAPQVLLAEDGSRSFQDSPAPTDAMGRLVVPGPAGLLPFSRTMAPGEWRALRVRLKVELVGGNVARGLRTLGEEPRSVVVVGGLAGDDEILAAVSGALPPGTAVGRGDVAGSLGHRYAVAYGLALIDARPD
jgi:diol dehydratase reactivase ATPase-like protein/cobalamin-dependent diol dehydratase reactivating factor